MNDYPEMKCQFCGTDRYVNMAAGNVAVCHQCVDEYMASRHPEPRMKGTWEVHQIKPFYTERYNEK